MEGKIYMRRAREEGARTQQVVDYTGGIRLGVWTRGKGRRGEKLQVCIHVFKLAYRILNITALLNKVGLEATNPPSLNPMKPVAYLLILLILPEFSSSSSSFLII